MKLLYKTFYYILVSFPKHVPLVITNSSLNFETTHGKAHNTYLTTIQHIRYVMHGILRKLLLTSPLLLPSPQMLDFTLVLVRG